MRFALLEIKLTLVKLLKKYKMERTEKTAVSLRIRRCNLGAISVSCCVALRHGQTHRHATLRNFKLFQKKSEEILYLDDTKTLSHQRPDQSPTS